MNELGGYRTGIRNITNDILCQFKAIIVQHRYKKILKKLKTEINTRN